MSTQGSDLSVLILPVAILTIFIPMYCSRFWKEAANISCRLRMGKGDPVPMVIIDLFLHWNSYLDTNFHVQSYNLSFDSTSSIGSIKLGHKVIEKIRPF